MEKKHVLVAATIILTVTIITLFLFADLQPSVNSSTSLSENDIVISKDTTIIYGALPTDKTKLSIDSGNGKIYTYTKHNDVS